MKIEGGNVCGFFTIHRGRDLNNLVKVSEFENLITNGGLFKLCSSSGYMEYCRLGTGNTVPTFEDTSLVSKIRESNAYASKEAGVNNIDKYLYVKIKYRFNPSGTAYNVSELGCGWGANGPLFNRALVKNANGDPVTISILADEYLIITYELRLYVPTGVVEGLLTPTGNLDNEPRTWSAMSNGNNSSGTLSNDIGTGWYLDSDVATTLNSNYGLNQLNNSGAYFRMTPNNVGLPFYALTGGSAYTPTSTANSETNISVVRTHSMEGNNVRLNALVNIPISIGNIVGGIKAFNLPMCGAAFKIGFSTPFMKTADSKFACNIGILYSRR